MGGVLVKVEGSIERALKQFKKRCSDAGLFIELKRRAFYEKPSEVRRRRERKKDKTIRDSQGFHPLTHSKKGDFRFNRRSKF